jgi:hypothetical protein
VFYGIVPCVASTSSAYPWAAIGSNSLIYKQKDERIAHLFIIFILMFVKIFRPFAYMPVFSFGVDFPARGCHKNIKYK